MPAFHEVQKPSFTTFQVPSDFSTGSPAFLMGSRVAFPSGVKTIVKRWRVVLVATKGLPLKNIALICVPSSAWADAGTYSSGSTARDNRIRIEKPLAATDLVRILKAGGVSV